MSQIEDKIRKQSDLFNDNDPQHGHLERFAEKLEKQNAIYRISYRKSMLKIAAVALLLLSVSYFTFNQFINQKSNTMASVIPIEYSNDMGEVLEYYDATSYLKTEEIEQYALNPEEALKSRQKAGRQLENLDARLAAIEKEYIKNPQNKQLKAALVNTKRKKSEVINQIVRQLEIAQSGYYAVNTTTIQF